MVLSDERGQEDNCNERWLSVFTSTGNHHQSLIRPLIDVFKWGLTITPISAHISHLTEQQRKKKLAKEEDIVGEGKSKRCSSLRLRLALHYPVMPISVHSDKWDLLRLHISWLKRHKTFPYQVDLTDFPVPFPSPVRPKQERPANSNPLLTLGRKAATRFSTRPQLQDRGFGKICLASLPNTPAISWLLDQATWCLGCLPTENFLPQTGCFFYKDTWANYFESLAWKYLLQRPYSVIILFFPATTKLCSDLVTFTKHSVTHLLW